MRDISKHQLFSLMIVFEIGSTTLFAIGIKAKQDAWIAILLAMAIGLGFAFIFTEFQKDFPEKNYVEIIISILGKWLGIPLSLLYAVYWLWPASRILREFGELMNLTFLPNTPLIVIISTFVYTSFYVLSLEIKVFGRTSEIIMPLIVFFILSTLILAFISGITNLSNLRPVLGEGVKPVLKIAYPTVSIFPFGLILVFAMYWNYIDDKTAVRKTTMHAIVLSGVLLSFTSIVYISSLGVNFASITSIPFVEVVKMINIGEFFTNLDAIGICVIFIGGFYMMSIFLDAVALVLQTVFKVKNFKLLLFFVCTLLFWTSIAFEPNYIYHQWMYPFDSNSFYTPFNHAIPVLLFLINWIKKESAKNKLK